MAKQLLFGGANLRRIEAGMALTPERFRQVLDRNLQSILDLTALANYQARVGDGLLMSAGGGRARAAPPKSFTMMRITAPS